MAMLSQEEEQAIRNSLDTVRSTMGLSDEVMRDTLGMERHIEKWMRANPNHYLTKRYSGRAYDLRNDIWEARQNFKRFYTDKSEYESNQGSAKDLSRQGAEATSERLRQSLGRFNDATSAPENGDANAGAAEPVDPGEAERANLTKWITEFTQSMGRPVDMNDPVFASLSNMGSARASMGVGQSGIRVGRGGLGELAIQQGANAAVTPYLQDRIRMQQQGLGMLQQGAISNEQLRQGKYGLNLQQAQMQNNVNQQLYGQQADAAGGVGATLGGLAGGALGAGLAAATGGALAPAIPGLIAGGSKIGAGAGMGTVQRPTLRAPRPYGGGGGGY